ncbi:hypothetical protein AWZ03_010491 [Drosophila navojoa]|uniref:Uncharacterized protein n=1 Tax=Drosophila navojoa TaxID=7232 RepID=A0A484B5H8_DRONA|nr:hypothetical protein AWZ03_010491 [Drosophila navojoa]
MGDGNRNIDIAETWTTPLASRPSPVATQTMPNPDSNPNANPNVNANANANANVERVQTDKGENLNAINVTNRGIFIFILIASNSSALIAV